MKASPRRPSAPPANSSGRQPTNSACPPSPSRTRARPRSARAAVDPPSVPRLSQRARRRRFTITATRPPARCILYPSSHCATGVHFLNTSSPKGIPPLGSSIVPKTREQNQTNVENDRVGDYPHQQCALIGGRLYGDRGKYNIVDTTAMTPPSGKEIHNQITRVQNTSRPLK